MTTEPLFLSLHSFHININVGDSSIHLLVDESKDLPEIHKAVLIDGGKNHQDQTEKIRAVITKIQTDYRFAADGNFGDDNVGRTLRFDAVVITHWDDDHFGGILGLVNSSFQTAIQEHPYIDSLLLATNDKIDKLEDLNTNVSGLQCPIFKYSSYSAAPSSIFTETVAGDTPDQNRPGDVPRADLLTTVYVPYMAGEREVMGNGVKTKKAKKIIADESSVGGVKCTWYDTKYGQKRRGAQMFSNNQTPYDKSENDNTFGVLVYFDHNGCVKPFRFWYTAKLVAYFDHYLGAELFYGSPLPVVHGRDHTTIQNPGQLIKAHSLTNAQGPRMYVVAGDQMVIGNMSLGSSATTSTVVAFNVVRQHKAKEISARHGIEHVVNVKHGAIGQGEPFDDRGSAESINSASLSVVVLTSRINTPAEITTTDDQASFSVQHYMAGDAIWDVEDAIARWLRNKTTTWFVESPFMKLSHHGASYSTPSSILAALIPKYIISPSGNSSVFGHPRPEILFWLHAMTVAMATGKPSGNKTIKLLMYNWPVWFTASAWDAPYFILNFLYKPSDDSWIEDTPSPEVVYLKAMQKMYTAFPDNPLKIWWARGLSKVIGHTPRAKLDKKTAIIQIYAALGPYISAISDQQFTDFIPEIRVIKCILHNNSDGTYSAGVDTWDGALAVRTLYTRTPVLTATSTTPAIGPPTTPSTIPSSTPPSPGTSTDPSGGGDGSSSSNDNNSGAITVEPSQPPKRRRNGARLKSTLLNAPVPSSRVLRKRVGANSVTPTVPAMQQMITDGEVEQPVDFDEESGAPAVAPAVRQNGDNDGTSNSNGGAQGGGHGTGGGSSKDPIDRTEMAVANKLHTPSALLSVQSASPARFVPEDVAVSNGSNTLALRSKVVTRDVASTAPSGPMFLCGSDFDSFAPMTNEDGSFEIPLETGPFNDFISLLGQGCIKLASQWNTSADGIQTAFVSSEDEWLTSLISNGLGVTNLVLTGSNDTAVAHVTAITATVTFAGGSGAPLTFTSTQSQVVAPPSDPPQPSPSPATVPAPPPPISSSFLSDYALLSLGLVTPTSQPFTVSDVLAVFAPTWLPMASGGTTYVLPGFDSLSHLPVTLSASASSRNQLSLRCDGPYTSWLRLRFDLHVTTLKSAFSNAFPFLMSSSDFAITNVSLCGLKETMNPIGYIGPSIKNKLSLEVDITLGGAQKSPDTLDIQAWIVFGETTTQFVLHFDPTADKDQITKYMARFIGLGDDQAPTLQPHGGSSGWLPNASAVNFEVLQVSLLLNNPQTGSSFSIQQLVTDFEVDVYGAIFHVSVSWTSGDVKLMGKLWTEIPPNFSTYALVPFYEPYDIITPRNPPQGIVGLTQILSSSSPSGADGTGTVAVPSEKMHLQTHITDLELSAEKKGAEIILTFTGSIGSTPPDESKPEAPKIVLGDLGLQCYYSSIHGYDIQFINTTYLLPRDFPASPAAALKVSVEYSKVNSTSAWKVTGTASNLNFASLFGLFDPDASHAVMDILEDFDIPNLYVEWDYSSGKADLSAMGSLIFGPFELDFTYTYDSKAAAEVKPGTNNWLFKASLGPKGSDSIILSDLIGDLTDDASIASAMADVPFVSSIEIPAANADNGDDPPIQLCVTKAVGGETVLWLMLSIVTEAGTISFSYVQMQAARSAPAAGISNADATKNGPTGYKRIFRVMLDKLPTLPNIPVIGQIDQPFDAIDYVFVSDSTPGVTSGGGFTTEELDLINGTMSADDHIPFRASKSDLQSSSPNNATKENPAVLLPGHHFILTADHVVVLDHIFGNKPSTPQADEGDTPSTSKPDEGASSKVVSKIPKQTPVSGSINVSRAVVKAGTGEPTAASTNTALTADSGSTNGPMNKSLGILTIQSIGLQCKDGYLYILISAIIMLGPIQLSLEGFGIGVELSMLKLNELKSLTIDDFSMILSGMSVYFNAPPVMIAGVFVHEDTSTYEAYKGGLAVSILPYTLLAVGEYEHTFDPDLKSVFVFARLDGPLFTLEFAAISGVEAGFGYNYQLATPAPKDVSSFPLVHGVTADQQNPMTTLTQFDAYNSVARDSMWFAIGFKVDAFEILTVDAAAIIQFGPSSTKINIIAIASASMPPKVTDRKEMFVYVELGITASLDILGGTLQISAALTPNSFLLYPDCHLTGGFALFYWFTGSPYAGDWVFTIGGYHPAFKRPTYYPDVDCEAINWNLSDVLTITGQSFFAITPKVVMGGGRLQAVFNAGPIYADFEAWASFLMTLKPFYFIADIGVSVSVGFSCDIGIIHINISADIGASLHLQGPPFGGVVYVDLWIHNFSIYFGDQNNAPPVLTWEQFVEVVLQQRGADASASSSALAVVAIEQGSANEKTTSSQQKTGDKWFVRCGSFQFRVESKIPINDMILTNEVTPWKASEQVKIPSPDDLKYAAYARLMHATSPLISDTAHREYGLRLNLDIAYPVTPDAGENPFRLTPIIRNMPNALWDKYNSAEDPNTSGNSIDTMLSPDPSNPTTRPLLTGFIISAPLPRLPAMNIPEFNATDAMSEGVFQDGGTPSKTAPSRPLLPVDSNNVDERPYLPQTADEQTIGRPATPSATPWRDIVDDWRKADDTRAQGVVDAWSALCGWGKNAPPAPATTDTAATTSAANNASISVAGTIAATTDTAATTSAANNASMSVAGTVAAPFVPLKVAKPVKELGKDGLDTFARYFVGCPFVSTAVA